LILCTKSTSSWCCCCLNYVRGWMNHHHDDDWDIVSSFLQKMKKKKKNRNSFSTAARRSTRGLVCTPHHRSVNWTMPSVVHTRFRVTFQRRPTICALYGKGND
jgi:hypothetical protein